MTLKSVKVPTSLEPLFESAENYVDQYFKSFKQNTEKGTIDIAGERYILIRASSMSVNFVEFIKNMYPSLNEEEALEATSKVLFDMAHVIGKSDAGAFHLKTGVKEPIKKLSTGPVHFAYMGWAFVDIFPESRPSPDDDYFLIYDHPQSFEAYSWLASKAGPTNFCTCFMNAGYSSGWCEESYGITLTAREILCRGRGDDYCRFIMATPHRIEEFIQSYRQNNPSLFKK